MKKLGVQNPLDLLTDDDLALFEKLRSEPNLDFLKAVEILGLDKAKDFRDSNLSGIKLDQIDLSTFDLAGAIYSDFQVPEKHTTYRVQEVHGTKHQTQIHKKGINSVRFSHNGSLIASTSSDRTAAVFSLHEKRSLMSFVNHEDMVIDAKFDSTANLLLTISLDGCVRLFSLTEKREVRRFIHPNESVTFAGFIEDESKITTIFNEDHGPEVFTTTMRIWDVKTGEVVGTNRLDSISGRVFGNLNNRLLARVCSIYVEKRIELLTSDGRSLQISIVGKDVKRISFSLDERYLCVSFWDSSVSVYSVKEGTKLYEFDACDEDVIGTAILANHEEVLTVSSRGYVRVWSSVTNSYVSNYYLNLQSKASCIDVFASTVAIGMQDGNLCLFDLNQN